MDSHKEKQLENYDQLWKNKSNCCHIWFEDLIIRRFTTQFLFIPRITDFRFNFNC